MKSTILKSIFLLACFTSVQAKSDSLTVEEFTYDEKEGLKIYCVRPLDYNPNKEYPAMLIFHGGGWSMGEASWGFSSAEHYASNGLIAFSVQYRLQESGNEITPYESVLDAQNAIRWVRKNAGKFSINENMIACYGWSAGAHLAACAAIFDNLGQPNANISSAPNLLLLKSPALSLLLYPNFQKRLHDNISVRDISPAESVSEGTPPTIIVIGKDDTVTPLEGSELFKKNMDKHKIQCDLVVYDGVGHLFTPSSEPDNGWPNPDKEVRLDAQKKMDEFLKKHNYIKN